MDRTKFVPWDYTNCLDLCKKVLANYGMTSYGSSGNVIQVATSGNGTIRPSGSNPTQNLKDAVECLDRHLNANRVIIVGVDYDPDKSENTDGTDHFIVITGRGYDSSMRQRYFTYMDNGTSDPYKGCSTSANRLYYMEGSDISGRSEVMGQKYYYVTHIRPND